MDKLLVICGPTGAGKTGLAIKIARKYNGEIVSADSRQVYKGLDIGTGKDLPKGAKLQHLWIKKFGFYEMGGVRVWGYDLADPRHGFNVSQYIKFAERIISDIVKRGKLPIIVGGTGLYIKSIIDGISTAEIPKNNRLRKKIEKIPTDELFEILAKIDPIKAASMNASDKKNPRRLARAIEIATWRVEHEKEGRELPDAKVKWDVLQIGLNADLSYLNKKIDERVTLRFRKRLEKEIADLLKNHVNWDMQSMSSMGYKEWRGFFEGEKTEKEVLEVWKSEEKKYIKKQMVWFKKDRRIKWFDISSEDYPENVEKMIEKWHNISNE